MLYESYRDCYDLLYMNEILMTFNLKKNSVIYDSTNILNYDLLPTLVKKSNLETWLLQRSIDTHRTNSRVLAKMLRLKHTDVLVNVIKAYASSLTDNYWIRPIDSTLTYEELIHQRRDFLYRVALLGEFNFDIYDKDVKPIRTPELTLGGSYEKCWIFNDNNRVWSMIKKGDYLETFNELLASELADILDFNHVTYTLYKGDSHYIQCDNFVETTNNIPKYDYEPMCYYLYDRDDDEDFYENLKVLYYVSRNDEGLRRRLVKDFTNMLFFDALILNFDRHTENYGLLRNSKTHKVESLAPLFDHNLSLLKNSMKNIDTGNKMIQSIYIPFIKDTYKSYRLQVPTLTLEQIKYCVDKTWCKVFNQQVPYNELPNISKEFLVEFIYNKYMLLKSGISY